MTVFAYAHHSAASGLGEWLARLVVRAAVYRAFFGLPLGVALVLGVIALGILIKITRSRSSRRAGRY